MNSTLREWRIISSYERLDQLTTQQILKKIQQNYTLKVLELRITDEARDDDQFIRDVELLIEQYNDDRQSKGVTTLLQIEF